MVRSTGVPQEVRFAGVYFFRNFWKSFFILYRSFYISYVNQKTLPMKSHCTHCGAIHERKGIYCSKKCADAAYRARKKAEPIEPKASTSDPEVVVERFSKAFGFPVRLYWNRRLEGKNSSCAKAGTLLEFEQITKVGGRVIYRVRRGKRNFFTSSREIEEL
jgi:hypothetical protein